MDVTPLIPKGRQVIEGYGDGGFRVSGEIYEGSIIVFPSRTIRWQVRSAGGLKFTDLESVLEAAGQGDLDLLLIGCGRKTELIGPELRRQARQAGIVIEAMDTGAACRTYNVLMAEERQVAAALIAID